MFFTNKKNGNGETARSTRQGARQAEAYAGKRKSKAGERKKTNKTKVVKTAARTLNRGDCLPAIPVMVFEDRGVFGRVQPNAALAVGSIGTWGIVACGHLDVSSFEFIAPIGKNIKLGCAA